jgi:hypothetical protein
MKYLWIWIVLLPFASAGQRWAWVQAAGGNRTAGAIRMNEGKGICADEDGNIYAVGSFAGRTSGGADTLESFGTSALLVKYDTAGNLEWRRKVTEGGSDYAYGVCADKAQRVCVTGIESGRVISGFTAMYDRYGSLLWRNETKGDDCQVTMRSVANDKVGNIYVAGDCKGVAEIDSFSVGAENKYTLFVVKYDIKGHVLWVRQSAATEKYYTQAISLAIDLQCHFFLAGTFEDSLRVGDITAKGPGSVDVFVARLSGFGSVDWIKTWGSSGADQVGNIAVDDAGNFYFTAFFSGQSKAGDLILNGENLVKCSPDGQTLWNLKIADAEHEYMVNSYVAVDRGGRPCITGYIYGAVPIFGNNMIFANGASDLFVAQCNANGKLLWQVQAGSSGTDEGEAICTGSDGNIYATGYFHERVDFGKNVVRSVSGDDGMWVGKLVPMTTDER